MRHIQLISILFCLLLASSAAGWVAEEGETGGFEGEEDTGPAYAEGSLLVRTEPVQGTVSQLSEATSAIGASVAFDYATLGAPGLSLIQLPDGLSVENATAYFQGIPGVIYAEPDFYRYPRIVPADPDFWRQWGLQNTGQVYLNNTTPGTPGADIKAVTAWDIITGGRETPVVVLDTGVDYTHPDLAANIWTDPVTGAHGYDTITRTSDPMDQNSHGTHCSGIIGAVAGNGIGGTGVVWNTTIIPVRFINQNGGTLSDEITGILWAKEKGARIFSCSYGGDYFSRTEHDVIRDTDALFLIAAGNNGTDNAVWPEYPAAYDLPNIISVASLEPNDTLSDFSNYGNTTVHIAAPGSKIFSTVRSKYQPDPVWAEPFDTLSNWTISGNWTLDPDTFVSPPYSVRGVADTKPAMLILNTTLNLSALERPVFSFSLKNGGEGIVRLEGSADGGLRWYPIYPARMKAKVTPFTFIQQQIPDSLHTENLMIRITLEKGICFIDDLSLSDGYGTLVEPSWMYYSGTSMATPMVAGITAMLMNTAPDAPVDEIKEIILSTADPVPDLQGRIITGGRVNLTAALLALEKSDAIPLGAGWNHVSVPFRLAPGSDTAAIFTGVNSSGHSVLRYNNDTTGYATLNVTDPVTPLQGYWIFSENATKVPVSFAEPVTGISRDISAGWSSVGGWAAGDQSANETFHTLGTGWSYAVGYDAAVQQYEEPIMRGGTGNQSDTRPIHPYSGYWLYSASNGTYQNGAG